MAAITTTSAHVSARANRWWPIHAKQSLRTRTFNRSSQADAFQAKPPGATPAPKPIGIVIFDQVASADVMGPADAFSQPSLSINRRESRCYEVITIGINNHLCATESGIILKPQLDIRQAPQLDTLIIPGGAGIHDPKVNKRLVRWLRRRAMGTRRIAGLGSGVYALAATGLLHAREVVTHWSIATDLSSRFPRLRVNSAKLFTHDESFYTCAGAAASVDLALALIEEDCGRKIALRVAREFVVPLKRSAGEEQYSESLKFQIQSCDRFADLPAWIVSHLNEDLSVDALAERACMSRRNFTRLFHNTFGKSPAQFVAEARIIEARRRVLVPRTNLATVAVSVGFKSPDVFSKTFERHVGVRPRTYRALCKASAAKIRAKRQLRGLRPKGMKSVPYSVARRTLGHHNFGK